MHIENIVIGKPICSFEQLFPKDKEKEMTIFTEERFLPKILVDLGVFKSNSDVRRNRPELFVQLDKPDFIELKIGKKFFWIVVGE